MASWPFMDDAEPDVLAYMTFPARHRTKLHSTNPIERLKRELDRRTPSWLWSILVYGAQAAACSSAP